MPRTLAFLLSMTALSSFVIGCGDDGSDVRPSSDDVTGDAADDASADLSERDGGDDAPQPDVIEPPDETTTPVVARVTMHRLNRAEYNNTVRDLLGTRLRPADDFPADDTGYGFDNIADVLSTSPLHVELYELAARALINEALRLPIHEAMTFEVAGRDGVADVGGPFRGRDGVADVGGPFRGRGWSLWSDGSWTGHVSVPRTGRYRLTVRLFSTAPETEAIQSTFTLDGSVVRRMSVSNGERSPEELEIELELTEGDRAFGVNVTGVSPEADGRVLRALVVEGVTLMGPLDLDAPGNSARERLIVCDEADGTFDARPCAEQSLAAFLPRAWRRPVSADEVQRLMALYDRVVEDGGSFDDAFGLALQAALMSPHFVFRVEPDAADAAGRALNDYEIASRLSYFLWSSMPDDRLFELAASGRLSDRSIIEAEVRRMLQDPRSDAMVDNFAGQWLYIRDIDNIFPDVWVFPTFDRELQVAMVQEMKLFFRTFIDEDRSMLELLTANETFVNERLARHYEIDGMDGEAFARVSLDGLPRGGILTQAGLLTVLSTPTRTSVVRRGKWVLGQLLCSEPDAPPPGVEGLPEQPEEGGTLREVLERHRANPDCAVCHDSIDPIGFGLEAFDGVGAFRTHENGTLIDDSGMLLGDTPFHGALELSALLAEDRRLPRCITEKLYMYALGRGLAAPDITSLRAIVDAFVGSGHRFVELAVAIATSDAFLFHPADPGQP